MEETKKVNYLINTSRITKMELSEKLGISRVTLDTRLKQSNWKKAELFLLRQFI